MRERLSAGHGLTAGPLSCFNGTMSVARILVPQVRPKDVTHDLV
jgi:hypothetical protein